MERIKLNSVVKSALAATALAALAALSNAAPVITNGSFESTTLAAAGKMTNTNVTGWTTTSGFTFLVFPGNPTQLDQFGDALWAASVSPDGGKFLASDGDFKVGAESQTVTGLTVGQKYSVSFYQAAAQQNLDTGATFEYWTVSLGSESHNSTQMNNASKGFTGWSKETLNFTATSTSEVLSFFAVGGPANLPPFVLLDGVSIAAVPEPGMLGLTGLAMLGVVAARRRKSKA